MALDPIGNKKKSKEVLQLNQGGGIPTKADVPGYREAARAEIAKIIVKGIFALLIILSTMLFILLLVGKESSSIFKDILLSFIGFASGTLVSVFGFYFKGQDKEN